MYKNPWEEFRDDDAYRLVDLGQEAVFNIPETKLGQMMADNESIETHIQTFLTKEFGGFSRSVVDSFGVWINSKQVIVEDRCRIYEVSFPGKARIPNLLKKLSEIARVINEECIYFTAGQYTCLIYPPEVR